MARRTNSTRRGTPQGSEGITRITVSGYKSISREQSIEIRPLTILAGANSSGKSSLMQPLLLLKQTLEANYDPGALLLNGPNVKFTSAEQLLSRTGKGRHANTFHVGIGVASNAILTIYFNRQAKQGFEIKQMVRAGEEFRFVYHYGMTEEEIESILSPSHYSPVGVWTADVVRNRCFLQLEPRPKNTLPSGIHTHLPAGDVQTYLQELIHLPGLRGNPERSYPRTSAGPTFPGTFENYTASVIAHWQTEKNADPINRLSSDLTRLGLTWKVTAKQTSDAQVELQVGRLTRAPRNGLNDLVNIADVGFGVSQTLPVLVSLLAAKPGQMVYLEQPEIHLHPRAQSAMAQVLADAAQRGVRVVTETHSALLLLGIQTLVAEGKVPPDIIKLHWFTRRDDGSTEITSADLDETGAFGDWPEDFAEVALETESRYLDASESRQRMRLRAG